VGSLGAGASTRPPVRLERARTRRHRCAGDVQRCHHVDALVRQDPLFALRILLDIAIKALSKAINDPTAAILAIDQLHRLLRSAGRRNLRTEQTVDQAGKLRVIFRTPNWEDFVHLAFSEIRFYGAGGKDGNAMATSIAVFLILTCSLPFLFAILVIKEFIDSASRQRALQRKLEQPQLEAEKHARQQTKEAIRQARNSYPIKKAA
jgi:uncharacterized membrane protein